MIQEEKPNIMKTLTLTKKQIKRTVAVVILAAAAAAAGVTIVATSVKTRAAQRRVPIYSVEREDKKIGLTFDAAWENSNTQELINILDEGGAKATFFVTGDWCDRYPDDVKLLYDAGHEIENHSDAHPHPVGMNVNDLINDTKECSRKIKMITGEEPRFYRAPYGEYDDDLLTTMDGMGLKTIQWDVDSVDWKKNSASDIKKKVLKNVKPGSILLFHNDLENTTEALPEIIKTLTDQGYEFVPLSELVYADNYTVDANGRQSISSNAANISQEKIEEVMAEYKDKLDAANISEEQIKALEEGNFDVLPDELRPLAEEVWENLSKDGAPMQLQGDESNVSDNSSSNVSDDESISSSSSQIYK